MNRIRLYSFVAALVLMVATTLAPRALAQHPDAPGHFDFYLMNLSWSPEFCAIQGTSPQCAARDGFILHGLWPQNNDGSYPVFCSHEAGPRDLAKNLDVTPDLALLQHEWDKHGTCSAVGPERFFGMEHQAYRSVRVPAEFQHMERELMLPPAQILGDFYSANPGYPQGSILLSCGRNNLTAIEVCLSKDLRPIACHGLHSCGANVVKVTPPGTHIR
ncbi:ribonuclease T2 [Bryocella elongata]|uniref:Ribonuclease T2 n=1 Tax=Bryocella elongata TaxID=863522 RepID=A0A1H5YIF2_9BACT|nr:ribonuclease T [Bryocella elongata]SEG23891.1 ribonuclease T2 [Bryocella elongata]